MESLTLFRKTLAAAVLAAAWSISASAPAQATPRACAGCGMVGLARGQIVRINVAHIGQPGSRPIQVQMALIDATGAVVASDSKTIEPGQAVSFDVPVEAVARGEDRIELRPVISGGPEPHLRMSLEVYDAETGKTTVFISNPEI